MVVINDELLRVMVSRGCWPFAELGLNGCRVIKIIVVVGRRGAVGRGKLSMLDFRFELAKSSTVFGELVVVLLNQFGVMLAVVFDVVTELCDNLLCGLLADLQQKIFIFQ